MKKNNRLPASVKFQEEVQTVEENFHDKSSVLIVLDLDELRINYINEIFSIYSGISSDFFINGKSDFFKEIVHPDDLSKFLRHLDSFRKTEGEEIKESIIRLRDRDGNWSEFCFQSRIYNWSPNGEKRALLIQAHKIDPAILDQANDDPCHEPSPSAEAQHRYYQLLNSIDQAYCIFKMIFDRNGKPVDYLFTETNPAFEEHVNLQNVQGKTMRELVPDHDEHWFQTYGKVATTGESIRFQSRSSALNNVWFDLYAFRVGGEFSRKVAVLFTNITERKIEEENLLQTTLELEQKATQRQKELLENTELLQTVFDSTNLAIAVLETLYDEKGEVKDFVFVRVNKVLREIYLQEEVIGKTYLQTSKHGVKMGIFDAFKEAMRTGEEMDEEYYFDKEGYNHWFRIGARKQNSLLITTIEDITARKEETRKLEEAVRFNRQLVQTSPDTILIINLNEYRVRYINQDMLTRAGMTKERILGMTLQEIIPYLHPRDREKLIEFHKKILKSSDDDILDLEFRVKVKGTDWEWFNARGKIFNRKDEKWVNEYVVLVRNITDQKNTQRALLNAEKLSIQGEIARTFAHELRNPLASIRMATDVMKHKLSESEKEEMGNYLDILSRSTKTLNDLVSNLLNSANYTPAVLQKADLAECLNLTIEQAADRIFLTGIKVVKKYKGPYPILADTEKLKIALLNIIVNASEATTPGEGVIELSIKKHKTDFLLSISDNGHGLEQEQINRLFDAFYTNKTNGAGIGLTSVKNILDEHDAQIKVHSKPNEGTTFEIFFHNAEHD